MKGFEELPASFPLIFFQEFFEIPNGISIGNFITEAKSSEALEAQTVLDLHLGRLVTEAMKFLENKDLEHKDGVEGRLATFAPILFGISRNFVAERAEEIPIENVA